MSSPPEHETRAEQVVTQGQLRRERLRLTDVRFVRTPNGRASAFVELEWLEGVRITGDAEGHTSPMADLRLAAVAAVRAVERFSEGQLGFELVGVKSLRVFDANVVIVALMVLRGGTAQRLLGSHLTEGDPVRSAVVAVLNATNRLLGNFIATR